MDAEKYPRCAVIADAVTTVWPRHAKFLAQSFAGRDHDLMASTEELADMVLRIIDSSNKTLNTYCADYRFMCSEVMAEELHFRREGNYRLSSFEQAYEEVYSNTEYMGRYMRFLLLSYILWDNHARAMADFRRSYLARLTDPTDHLEIGPGHGLLAYLASSTPAVASVTGWDVSDTSLQQTRDCLSAVGRAGITLERHDIYDPVGKDERRFGSVVLSEILEHLEDPVGALRAAAAWMRPGAWLWVNVPVNSPAPDHIFLLRTPEEAVELVRTAGFTPVDTAFYPMTGRTLDEARREKLTISVIVTARL